MGKFRKKWSDTELSQALAAVRCGEPVSTVSKVFHIPRTTLLYKSNGKLPIGKSVGPAAILSSDEERKLVQWMLYCSKRGFLVTKTQLISSVAQLIKKFKRNTPFKNGIPGRSWYEGFLRRHPEINTLFAQSLTHCQSVITEEALQNWFAEVQLHLDEKGLTSINGSRKFNCDESAFYIRPKGDRVLVKKGEKGVYNFVMNDEKECLTTMFIANAIGMLVPPMIVFSYERIPHSISQSVPANWSFGKSENGWMTEETFFEYISGVFDPWLTANNIEKPVILFLDSHSSYLTMPVVQFCMTQGIELIALYPNASHLIQPLYVALFQPLKAVWKKDIHEWLIKNERKLRREDFGLLLKTAVDKLNLAEIMANGFRACGLHPFSADAIKYKDLLQKAKEDNLNPSLAAQFEKKEVKKNLAFIEQNIDGELLQAFRTAEKTGIWNGDLENLGLFSFWMKVANLSKQ